MAAVGFGQLSVSLGTSGSDSAGVGTGGHWRFDWDAAFQCVDPRISRELGEVAPAESNVLNNCLGVGDSEILFGREVHLSSSLSYSYLDPSFYRTIG